MLYDLEGFSAPLRRTCTADDITMVIAVRLHQGNPWVVERLRALAGYYEPAPKVLIVDFGSRPEHAARIAAACATAGLELLRVEDEGVFCAAKARNHGAAHVRTELIFFSDVDCFGERDLFARLVRFANASDFGACFDQVAVLPVYHLGAAATARFFETEDAHERSAALSRAFAASVLSAPGAVAEYVDPCSNFFLIRRDFFDYVGGYNESFRGHGSEDFELLIRVAMYSLQFPQPDAMLEDEYGPLRDDFFGPKPYRSFRRLLELMALPAQLAGLRIAHLHHRRARDGGGWYENRDSARERFHAQLVPVLENRARLLERDFMPRPKRALVLIRRESHADVFFPLRMAGYALTPVYADDAASFTNAMRLLDARGVDAVAMMNPYMKSHASLKPVFDEARARGVRTIVFERGALPESWYYASELSYADPELTNASPSERDFSTEELALADAYMERLRTGAATLEPNGDYAATRGRLASTRAAHAHICFVPLQLEDDVAVTHFAEGFTSYAEFVRELPRVAKQRPDVLFLVKPHPLAEPSLAALPSNVVVCRPDENVHALLDVADAVVCYNSGVGLLALIHEKKLVTVGNAFYNLPGLGGRATTLEAAVTLAFDEATRFDPRPVRLLVAFLLGRKYSFFCGESVVREGASRRLHGFRNLLWYRLQLDGSRSARRAALDDRVAAESCATALLGIGEELRASDPDDRAWMQAGDGSRRIVAPTRTRLGTKLEKLIREPRRFFEDSNRPLVRVLASAVPEDAGSPSMARTLGRLLRGAGKVLAEARGPVDAHRSRDDES